MNTKTELEQVLLVEELLNKRLDNIRGLKRGLMVLGFADMCQTNIDLTSPLYLYTPKEFIAADFLKLVQEKPKKPPLTALTANERRAYLWFIDFIQQQETVPTEATLVEQGILLCRKLMHVIYNITITLAGAVASLPLVL